MGRSPPAVRGPNKPRFQERIEIPFRQSTTTWWSRSKPITQQGRLPRGSRAQGHSRHERDAPSCRDDWAPCSADSELTSSGPDADLVIEFERFAAMRDVPATGIRVLEPSGDERARAPVDREDRAAPRGGARQTTQART